MRTELRRGNWQRLAQGIVLTDAHPPTRDDWAEAGVLLAGAGSAVSGWDALRHHGIAPASPPPVPVFVLAPRGGIRTVGGVHIRRTSRPFTFRFAPGRRLIRIVQPARAVADAAL